MPCTGAEVRVLPSRLIFNTVHMEKKLGKIEKVSFGLGGYQSTQLGLQVELKFEEHSVCGDSIGFWDAETVKHNEHCQWSEEDRDKEYAKTLRFVSKLLKDAKVPTVDRLKGVPVEVTLENRSLKSWRILTEVV